MAKNTSILLADYFDKFINRQIKSGRYSSASEVIRTALRLFEQEENRKDQLLKELKKGKSQVSLKNLIERNFSKNRATNIFS